jgi:hypothetical protein
MSNDFLLDIIEYRNTDRRIILIAVTSPLPLPVHFSSQFCPGLFGLNNVV